MRPDELKSYITNINDPSQQSVVLESIEEIKKIGDYKDKKGMLEYLSSLLSKQGEDIEKNNPSFYEQLQSSWLILAFSSLPVLEPDDRDNLLQKKFFSAIQKGFNPDNLTRDFFVIYESDEFIGDLFKHFIQDLEENVETLGSLPIEVEGKRMLPTLKYWLLDYSKFPSKIAHRGSVERLNYLTQSANVRQLTQGQRQNLSKLMKFYDDLIACERPVNLQGHYQSEDSESPLKVPVPVAINIDEKLDELKERTQR